MAFTVHVHGVGRTLEHSGPDKCGFRGDESAMGLETLIILLSLVMQRLVRAREFLKTAGEVYEHARGYVILKESAKYP
jgi:hypothetical protein